MNSITVVLAVCISAALALPSFPSFQFGESGVVASNCTADVCKIENGCRCASSINPLPSDQTAPQLITLTFDEAVTDDLYDSYWIPLLGERVNPDGRRIGATFFVPHEYTNYQKVNDLYNRGFEIAVHSITKNPLQSYWREASEQLLEEEFGGQKTIISKFANIPTEDVIGARTPQFQLAGNATIEAYQKSGLTYDNSWPTLHSRPLFPYTLDYLTEQQCTLGFECPNEAFDGFWVIPILDLVGQENNECNALASCITSGTTEEIAQWIITEIERVRSSTRAPITLLVGSNWFTGTANSWEGLNQALDTLTTYDDVFLVSQRQVLDWVRNPVPASSFETAVYNRSSECNTYRCLLRLEVDYTDRYMDTCVPCPATYPWIGNPDGN